VDARGVKAPEAFHDAEFSHKSDVWAFGVLMWEACSLGATPYDELDALAVFDAINTGSRLDEPLFTPPGLYSIMRRCWSRRPERRPGFSELHVEVSGLARSLQASPSDGRLTLDRHGKLVSWNAFAGASAAPTAAAAGSGSTPVASADGERAAAGSEDPMPRIQARNGALPALNLERGPRTKAAKQITDLSPIARGAEAKPQRSRKDRLLANLSLNLTSGSSSDPARLSVGQGSAPVLPKSLPSSRKNSATDLFVSRNLGAGMDAQDLEARERAHEGGGGGGGGGGGQELGFPQLPGSPLELLPSVPHAPLPHTLPALKIQTHPQTPRSQQGGVPAEPPSPSPSRSPPLPPCSALTLPPGSPPGATSRKVLVGSPARV